MDLSPSKTARDKEFRADALGEDVRVPKQAFQIAQVSLQSHFFFCGSNSINNSNWYRSKNKQF